MRPLNKYDVGESITYANGRKHTITDEYRPYRKAKYPLCNNFGQVCVYCEAAYCYPRDLHVEHILPKDKSLGYSGLKYKWNNFLLACSTCNGTDNKGNTVKLPHECHFPHLNNTFLSLTYKKGGVVTVNDKLTGISRQKAEALLALVGLGKSPKQSSPGDTRWQYRKEKWEIAKRYRTDYEAGELSVNAIIDYVKASGCWSIWFTVFDGIDEVRRRLIEDFSGTAAQCFDPTDNYNPIPRNPGDADPV